MNTDIRNLSKWLNEEQEAPIDRQALARVLAMAEQPAQDNIYGYAKYLAEAMFKRHFASDEHYASGRVVWGVNDTVIGILTQIDNMVADMVRKPAQQEPVAWICHQLNKVKSLWWDKNQAVHLNAGFEFTPLYTSPPTLSLAQHKPWVGLEPKDFDGVIKSDAFEAGAYWANNKLREKNT